MDDVIITIDSKTRTVVHCNAAIRTVFGYEPEEIIGGGTEIFHVDAGSHAAFARQGNPVLERGESFETEYRFRRKSGEIFEAEVTVTPISEERTWIDGVVSVIRDVSETKQETRARLSHEQRLRLVVEQLPAVIWTTDRELSVTSVMGSEKVHLPDNGPTFVNSKVARVLAFNGTDAAPAEAHRRALAGEHGSYEVDYNGIAFQGYTKPLYDGGEIVGVLGLAYDIGDRKAFETQLQNSVREKEILLKEINHRVKNNLQLIKSMLSFQARGAHCKEARELLETSRERVDSLSKLYDLLIQGSSVSRLEMEEYLRSVIAGFSGFLEQPIQFHADLCELRAPIDVAVPLGLILHELIANCVRHAFPDGERGNVWVELSEEMEEYLLTVTDDGIGAEAEALQKAGSLGTLIVRSLAEQIGGTVTFEPRDDAGMRVELRFSAASD